MKTLHLNVTDRNIQRASKRDSHRCMIADAVVQKHPKAKWVSVDLQSVRFTVGKERFKYFTPPEAQKSLIDFDQGREVKPFAVTLKEGICIKAGWAAQRPKGRKRDHKTAKPRAKETKPRKKRVWPQREREFGLRKLKQ